MKTRIQARAITFNSEDKTILLVRNAEAEFWYAPGGGQEDGEHIRQCAVRETKEETGLNIDLRRLLYVHELHDEKGEIVVMELFWLAELSHKQELDNSHVDPDSEDGVEEAHWFTKDELQDLRVYPKM